MIRRLDLEEAQGPMLDLIGRRVSVKRDSSGIHELSSWLKSGLMEDDGTYRERIRDAAIRQNLYIREVIAEGRVRIPEIELARIREELAVWKERALTYRAAIRRIDPVWLGEEG